MVTSVGDSRDDIKAKLLQLVDKHLQAADTYSNLEDDKKMELKTTMGEEGGIGLTVTKLFAQGVTLDDLKEFYKPESMLDNQHKLDDAISGRKLEDLDGLPLLYQHIKCPPLVSNRRCFITMYAYADGDDYIILTTS